MFRTSTSRHLSRESWEHLHFYAPDPTLTSPTPPQSILAHPTRRKTLSRRIIPLLSTSTIIITDESHMASTLTSISPSKPPQFQRPPSAQSNQLNRRLSQASENNGAYTETDAATIPAFSPPKRTGYLDPNLSFNMGSGSQGGGSFAMQPGSYRQFNDQNGAPNINTQAQPQIYSASYHILNPNYPS